MTFTEAAAQVLRLVGKPLHYKEITDVAIEKNLLSHVGKSPEVTMGARLAALVKKGDKENPLIRVKPGVFALREWDRETIEKGLQDRTPALERLAQAFGDQEVEVQEAGEEEPANSAGPEPSRPSRTEIGEEEAPPPDEDELRRAEIAARATEIFAAEEDDELPIFGNGEAENGAAEPDDDRLGGDGNRRRRRRRRGRGRGADEVRGGGDLPSYTVSDAPAELAEPPADSEPPAERSANFERPVNLERPALLDRGGPLDRGGVDRPAPFERAPAPDRAFERDDRRGDVKRPPLEDLAGRELADAIFSLLSTYDKNRGPVGLQALAEAAVRRGRLSDMQTGQALIGAATRADNQRRSSLGLRPRFRIAGNRLGLTDWLLDPELVRLERDLSTTAERFREASRRLMLRRLQELPQRAIGELILLLLERLGFSELNTVRRPGTHGAELHLSGKSSGPAGEIRAAIVVRRDGREIGRERVTELRGALHHYGPASAGWLITTGQVLSGAREEASAAGAAPVTLVDGLGLAKLCEEHTIATLQTRVTLPLPDVDLLDALRSG
jgi:hypothetical protein